MPRAPRRRVRHRLAPVFVAAGAACPLALEAQGVARPDTGRADTLRSSLLAPITVSVTRLDLPLAAVPGAVAVVRGTDIARARPTWGLDEALATAPGVYASNRYNFSLDQRIAIRGFGARSSFGIRGVKILLDGIPQTLPDGTGQLTNVQLGDAERIEVLRGPSSALFGNASGGVISIRTDPSPPEGITERVQVMAGTFDRTQLPIVGRTTDRTWTRWEAGTRFRVGEGFGALTVSRLSYGGERQHTTADLRNLNVRYTAPLARDLTATVVADAGDEPRADNPGALTAAELARNPDSAAAINLRERAGKDVSQYQAGLTLRRSLGAGGDATLTLFGLVRDLLNPQTFAYIRLRRRAFGARAALTGPLRLGPLTQLVTAGLDYQQQRDGRINDGNVAGAPDTVRQLDQRERVTEIGPFAQSAIRLGPRTTLTAGLRYDWVAFSVADRLVTSTNPDDSGRRLMASQSAAVGASHALGPAATVYASVGTSFETPTTTELANRPDTAGGFNPALGPQRATNYELGVRGSVAGRVRYSLAAYQDDVRGELIAYQVPASPGRGFYRNAGRSRHLGLEFGADATLAPGVRVVVTWTQSDFRYTSYVANGNRLDGRRIPGVPAAWLHLLWQLRPGLTSGWWLEIQQTHSSSVLVDDTLQARAAGWWVTDLRLGWDGKIGGAAVSPFLGLNNAFDRRYVSSVVINANQGRYYEPAPGRNVYVGVAVGVGR